MKQSDIKDFGTLYSYLIEHTDGMGEYPTALVLPEKVIKNIKDVLKEISDIHLVKQ